MADAPLILVLNHFADWRPPDGRGWPLPCRITTDRARIAEADAVVYHLPGWRGPPLVPRRCGQTTVALSLESDVNCPLLGHPTFMAQFDLTMTYRRDADIWCAYLDPQTGRDLLTPPRPKTAAALAVWFASNPLERSGRTRYASELMQRIPIDSFGRVLQNRRLLWDRGRVTRLSVMARYRFTLAFENSICPDYVTEKFFDPLVAGSVPVYLGAPNVRELAPADDCFIDVSDFAGPADLADHLAHLAAHEAEYARYLAWRDRGLRPAFQALLEEQRLSGWCRLCMLLHERRRGRALAAT